MLKKIRHKFFCLMLAAAVWAGIVPGLAGCGAQTEDESFSETDTDTEVLNDSELQEYYDPGTAVISIGDTQVSMAQAYVYVYLMQIPYDTYYGSGLWEMTRPDGVRWDDWLLEEVKKQITETEILSKRAQEEGLTLDADTLESVDGEASAAWEQMRILSEYGADPGTVTEIYEKSALAGSYYEMKLGEYDVTLSESELEQCHAITVMQIYIPRDEGETSDGGDAAEEAEDILNRVMSGENFETAARLYCSDKAEWILTFDINGYAFDTQGQLEEDFVKAAWKLEEGETSPVIESSYGFHILRCTEKDSEELVALAKEHMLEEKRSLLFASDYEEWLGDTECEILDAWNEIGVIQSF